MAHRLPDCSFCKRQRDSADAVLKLMTIDAPKELRNRYAEKTVTPKCVRAHVGACRRPAGL